MIMEERIIKRGEIILLKLFDVGRSIDIKGLRKRIAADLKYSELHHNYDLINLKIPQPMRFKFEEIAQEKEKFGKVIINFNVYEDGVISITVRIGLFGFKFKDIRLFPETKISFSSGNFSLYDLLQYYYDDCMILINDYINREQYLESVFESEEYLLFCINDSLENIRDFVEHNKNFIASLLMREKSPAKLHPKQVQKALKNPFYFYKNDVNIFDEDRGFIIDPSADYEDIIMIIEMAKYQLLEFRIVDKLIDRRLDEAEIDIKNAFIESKNIWNSFNKKLGRLYQLRYDAIFLLENIENIRKVINDHYLTEIYEHLGNLFYLDNWSQSIHRRLSMLDDIYSTAKTHYHEKLLLILELLIVIFFIVDLILLFLELITN